MEPFICPRCSSCAVLLVYVDTGDGCGVWAHSQKATTLCELPTVWVGDLPVEEEEMQ